MDRLRRPFYGWWIVGAAIVLQALPAGLLQQAYGSYVVLLEREFGWSRTTLSGAFSAVRMEEGLLGPLQGWLLDRFGPRAVMRVGVLFFSGGFFLFARIDTVVGFYASFLVMAIGASLVGYLSVITAIVNWFQRKRSTAMGLALLGTALGGMALPLVVWGLENWGWRAVANLSGVIILVVGLPVTQIVRHRPQQYGLLPDGRQPGEGPDGMGDVDAPEGPAYTTREALRTRAFWFISFSHTGGVLVVSVIQVHFIAYVTEGMGLTLTVAAWMFTLQTLTNLVARPLGGWIGDRTNSRHVIAVAMLGHGAALLILALSTNVWGVAFSALLNGACWGVRVPVVVSMRAEYFGSGSFGAIMGVSSIVVTAGAVIAPIAAAWAYDALGSYTLAFIVLAALSALASLFMLFMGDPDDGPPARAEAPPAAGRGVVA